MMPLLLAILAMLLVPGLIWAGFWSLARPRQLLRLLVTAALPPAIAVGALAVDAANSSDKAIDAPAYFLVFIFPFIISIGVAGFCEAWAGKKRK